MRTRRLTRFSLEEQRDLVNTSAASTCLRQALKGTIFEDVQVCNISICNFVSKKFVSFLFCFVQSIAFYLGSPCSPEDSSR